MLPPRRVGAVTSELSGCVTTIVGAAIDGNSDVCGWGCGEGNETHIHEESLAAEGGKDVWNRDEGDEGDNGKDEFDNISRPEKGSFRAAGEGNRSKDEVDDKAECQDENIRRSTDDSDGSKARFDD
jgi:hypothetical protein